MSEEALHHKIDRTGWEPGPWDNEPDRTDWEHAGLPCFALRNDLGSWCGYTGVPPGHPLYGKDYNAVDVSVHGGLTYCGACSPPICHVPKPGEPDDVWWFGFDCGHFMDVMPGMEARLRRYEIRNRVFTEDSQHPMCQYRTLDYVRAEVNSLAEQLAK